MTTTHRYSPLRTYLIATAAVVVTVGVRYALSPILGPMVPFITLFPGVVFASWYGGARPGCFATALGAALALLLFIEPVGSFIPANRSDLVTVGMFLLMGGIVSVLVGRGEESRRVLAAERENLAVTFASIGDAVIATDSAGRVTYLNPVAEAATGWTAAEAQGLPLDAVFRIVNESTRLPVASPAEKAIASGRVIGLANHTLLLARDGREVPIDDSAAPVRGADGRVRGAILIFRDITGRRAAERRQQFLADLAAATQPLTDPNELTALTARLLGEHLGCDRCAYAEVEDESVYVITGDYCRGVPSIVGRWPVAAFGAEHHRMMKADESYVVHDADSDPRIRPDDLPAYRATAIQAVICLPLLKGGRLSAAMAVHQRAARRWTDDEVALVRTVVGRCWEALERARALRRLQASEDRLRLATEGAGVGTWEMDLRTGRGSWSADAVRLFASDRAEFTADDWTAAVHPDDRERAGEAWRRAVDKGTPYEIEFRTAAPDAGGGDRWLLSRGRVERDAAGRPVRGAGVLLDVTAKRRAEEAVRAGEAFTRSVTDVAPSILYVYDLAEHRNVWGNREVTTLLGFSREELDALAGDLVPTLLHPDDRAPYDGHVARILALADGELAEFEYRMRHADGSYRWLFSRDMVFRRDASGRPTQIVGAAVDITDRKRAEEALRASEDEARRQLAELNAIYATAPLGLGVFDREVRYVRINQRLAEMNGVSVEQHLGRSVWEVVPDLADHAGDIHRRVLSTGRTVREEFRGVTAADPSTQRVWDSFWFPVAGPDGSPEGVAIIVEDVTAARQTEEALRRRERELQTLTDNAPDVIARFDRAHRHVFVSAAIERVTGEKAEAFVGKTNRDLGMPAELCDRWEAAVDAAFRGEPQAVDFWFPSPGGRRFFVSRFVPEFGPDGRVDHVLCVASDQTERKAAEEALGEAARSLARERERLAVALRAARLGVYEWRVGEPAVWWSPEIYPVYGADPATFTPTLEAFTALVHPDDRAELWRKTEECLARKEEFAHEYRVVRPDGSVRWVMNRSTVGLGAAGDPERITGVAADVTEWREAEAALRAGEERFRLAASAGRVGVWEWHFPSNTVSWSDSLYPIHGVSKAEFDGTVEGFTALVHPDDRGPVGGAIRRTLEEGAPYGLEFRAVRPDGGVVWLYTQAAVIRDAAGAPVRMLGATVDVTERKRVEEALRDADRRKDEYLATLAHELRNPLAPMRNGLQVMRLAGGSGEAAERARAMMDRQLSHMVRLIDDLLDVSRISRGKLTLRRERLLLSDAITSAVETARPAIDAARHTLDVSIPPDPVYLDADPTRLSQVFSNLLTNSAKYTPAGGCIWLAVERTERAAVVSVRDSGLGIPAEALPRIFDMFSQVDRSLERNTGGLGIGLALVKGLVEMHGGSVTAQSPGPGLGSTVTVTLPLEAVQPQAPELLDEASVVGSRLSRRVLVVDDNTDSAESMAEMLKLLGHDVRVAHDGVEAVEAADAFRPEVVLMDVGMPKMNGYDATRRIRERPWGKGVTVVALTGWGQEGDREQSREAGCDGHLVKPAVIADLMPYLDTPGTGSPG